MTERLDPKACVDMTTQIVAAYVAHNSVAASGLPEVISTVADSLKGLGAEAAPKPVVSVRSSVAKNHLTCLICGKKQRMLKRHLMSLHELTPDAYRALFGLNANYPMTAPNYSKVRSELARKIGLGRRATPVTRRTKAKTQRKTASRKRAA